MTIGYTGGWTAKAGLLIQNTGSNGKPVDAKRQGQADAGIGGHQSQRAEYGENG